MGQLIKPPMRYWNILMLKKYNHELDIGERNPTVTRSTWICLVQGI